MDLHAAEQVVDSLFTTLEEEGQDDYIGESVSQLEHSLQAAHCATLSGSSNEVILAALLHDCGQILPIKLLSKITSDVQNMRLATGISVGRHGHEHIGSQYLALLGFPPIVCELVRDHVVAKRYLTAVEDGYHESLSETSKRSLDFQGGPFSSPELKEFEADPLFEEKVLMRRFDDAAKEAGKKVPGLSAYRTLIAR